MIKPMSKISTYAAFSLCLSALFAFGEEPFSMQNTDVTQTAHDKGNALFAKAYEEILKTNKALTATLKSAETELSTALKSPKTLKNLSDITQITEKDLKVIMTILTENGDVNKNGNTYILASKGVKPDDILSDNNNFININGKVIRKGSIAAFLKNIDQFEAEKSTKEEKDAALLMIKELAVSMVVLGLHKHVTFKNKDIEAILNEVIL